MRTDLKRPELIHLTLLSLLTAPAISGDEIAYPETRRVEQVDTCHGVRVADPYRWLEDLESDETHAWMKAQEEALASFLDRAAVDRLAARIEHFADTGAWYSAPRLAGGRYFHTVQERQQRHPVVVSRPGLDGAASTVLDPNRVLSEDQGFGGFSVSPGGRYLAYLVTVSSPDDDDPYPPGSSAPPEVRRCWTLLRLRDEPEPGDLGPDEVLAVTLPDDAGEVEHRDPSAAAAGLLQILA